MFTVDGLKAWPNWIHFLENPRNNEGFIKLEFFEIPQAMKS